MNLQRETFGDRRFADARLADEQRIVLAPPAKDLDGPLQLRNASDERIDLAVLGAFVQVHGKELERIAGRTARFIIGGNEGRLRRNDRGSADPVRQVAEHVEFVHSLAAEKIHSLRTLGLVEGGEHLAGVHFLAAGALGVELRVLHDALQHCRQHRLFVGVLGELLERLFQEVVELFLEHVDVPTAGADDVDDVVVVQQREKQMLERDVLVPPPHRLGQGEFE